MSPNQIFCFIFGKKKRDLVQLHSSGGTSDVLIFSTVIAPNVSFSLHHMEWEQWNIKQLRYEWSAKKIERIPWKQIVRADGKLFKKKKNRTKLCDKNFD